MAEYLIQDTTLDAIADAINAKTGGSSAMTPAEMAAAIAAIPTGGGLPALISEIECGDIRMASALDSLTIQTSLNHDPDFVIIFVKEVWQRTYNNSNGKYIVFSQFVFARQQGQTPMIQTAIAGNYSCSITFNNGDITFSNGLGVRPKFSPTQFIDNDGNTEPISYRWIAGSFVSGGDSQ